MQIPTHLKRRNSNYLDHGNKDGWHGFKKDTNEIDVLVRCVGNAPIYIGQNVYIRAFALIVANGPLIIEDNVHIGSHCSIHSAKGITLRRGVHLAPGVRVFTQTDDYGAMTLTGSTWPIDQKSTLHGPVEIGEHSVIGANSIVLPNVNIAPWTSVGALSLISKSIEEEGWLWAGTPIKAIRKRG